MLKKIENTLLEIFFLVFSVYALVYNLLTREKMGIIKIILVII